MLTNISKRDINRIGRIIAERHPDIAQKYITPVPTLTDFSLMPALKNWCFETFNCYDKGDATIKFICVILELYAPTSLEFVSINMKPGLRRAISNTLEYENGSNINSWLSIARAYYKGKPFQQKIEKLVIQAKNYINADDIN